MKKPTGACGGLHKGRTMSKRITAPGTGVHPSTKCSQCRITAAESSKLPSVATGIDHPVYNQTKSFYRSGGCNTGVPVTHMCPRCHREEALEGAMRAMDSYAKKHGEKALGKLMVG